MSVFSLDLECGKASLKISDSDSSKMQFGSNRELDHAGKIFEVSSVLKPIDFTMEFEQGSLIGIRDFSGFLLFDSRTISDIICRRRPLRFGTVIIT